MVVPTPSLAVMPGSLKASGATVVPVRVRQDGACDVDAMAEALTDKPAWSFSAHPTTRPARCSAPDEVMRLAHAVPDTALFVVDEAYYEYGIHAGGDDHLAALASKGPWVSFRTFSKAYGLAGMRVGYALCGSDEVADAFSKNAFGFQRERGRASGRIGGLGGPRPHADDTGEDPDRAGTD